jgi:hypothetical protein
MALSRYIEMLEDSEMNLLVFKGGELVFSSDSRGIKPLVEAIDALGERLEDIVTADRIVGRAAALLNMHLGSREVHALLISAGAKDLLLELGVRFEYRKETDAIKTKNGVIFCPFERMVQDVSDPEEAYLRIREELLDL